MLDSDHGVPKIFKICICNKANDIFKVWLKFRIPLFIFVYHICITLAIWTNLVLPKRYTAWKVSKYGFFSGPYFATFALNTERYSVSLRIQSKCGKIRTSTFHAVRVKENITIRKKWNVKIQIMNEKKWRWKTNFLLQSPIIVIFMSCESLIFGDLKYIHCWRNNQYFLYIVLYIPLVLSILKNEINNFFDEH